MTLHRRHFLAAGAAALAAPAVLGAGLPQVVIIGGGAGGASTARALAVAGGVQVTLVEPSRAYYSCFFSNIYLGGFRDMASLGHTYGGLAGAGVNVIHDYAVGVAREAKTVTLAGGAVLPYDRLVVSPGIDFIEGAVPGWSIAAQNAMPHAYKSGGAQTELLRAQVLAMPPGGVFAMVAPPNPYRCPPGPYERISMVAHLLKAHNPTAKIIIADPKERFAKQALFEEGWATHYSGMIDRIGPEFGGGDVSVDPQTMTLTVDGEMMQVDVCNVIPAMKAGPIAEAAGLTEGAWAPVNAVDMTSRMDPNIHVLGDAAAQGDMPKSAFAANSQSKVCALAIQEQLLGLKAPEPFYANTCWSLISPENAVKVGATYEATPEKIAKVDGFLSELGEPSELRADTYAESTAWYRGITADMFGA